MRFRLFPKREEDINNIFRFLALTLILVALPVAVILSQRETHLLEEAKETSEVSPSRPFKEVKLENVKTEFVQPKSFAVGWVKSNDAELNHLGDDDIHAGFWGEDEYLGVLQFDLSSLPEEARILGVQISFIGKSDARLGESGEWRVEILAESLDEEFVNKGFSDFLNAPVLATLQPILEVSDLKVLEETSFTFTSEETELVKQRFASSRKVSFRIVGPAASQDIISNLLGKKEEFNLFTWESGYGEGTFKIKPVMEILYTL